LEFDVGSYAKGAEANERKGNELFPAEAEYAFSVGRHATEEKVFCSVFMVCVQAE